MRKVCALSGAVLLLCLLMVAGCGDDDKKPTNPLTPVPTSLVATWWFNSATKNGTPIPYDSLNYNSSGVDQSVTFTSNHTWSMTEYDNSDNPVYTSSGTFTIENNWIHIKVLLENGSPADPDDTSSSQWSATTTQLTISNTIIFDQQSITIIAIYDKE